MVLTGVIRWVVIDRHGFVPPFLDLPNMQSWVDRFAIGTQNLYTRYGALLAGVIGAYLMVFHQQRVRQFFSRTTLVNGLAVACIAIIIPTGYFAMSSPLFNEVPLFARMLYYSHHRDVFALCVMFLVLAATHSAGFVGQQLRHALSWKVLFPIAQSPTRSISSTRCSCSGCFQRPRSSFIRALRARATMAVAAVIALAMSFAGETLLYLLVEQPSMRARALPFVRRIAEGTRGPGYRTQGRTEKQEALPRALSPEP